VLAFAVLHLSPLPWARGFISDQDRAGKVGTEGRALRRMKVGGRQCAACFGSSLAGRSPICATRRRRSWDLGESAGRAERGGKLRAASPVTNTM